MKWLLWRLHSMTFYPLNSLTSTNPAIPGYTPKLQEFMGLTLVLQVSTWKRCWLAKDHQEMGPQHFWTGGHFRSSNTVSNKTAATTGCNISFKKGSDVEVVLGMLKVASVTSFLYWKCGSPTGTAHRHTTALNAPFSCPTKTAWQPHPVFPSCSSYLASTELHKNPPSKTRKKHHIRPLWLCIGTSLLAADWEKCICLMMHDWLNLLDCTSLRRFHFLLETDSCQNNMLIITGVIILHSIVTQFDTSHSL